MGIIQKIRGYIMALIKQILQQKESLDGAISDDMAGNIELWAQLASGSAPWNKESPSVGLPKAIAQELADAIQEEIEVASENPTLNVAMNNLDNDASEIIQKMAINAGCLCRPVFSNGRLQHELLPLGNYIPIEYDYDKTLTHCLILKQFKEKKNEYTLVEEHKYINGNHTIELRLYESSGALKERGLKTTRMTESLTPYVEWTNVKKPFVIEFRNKGINTIDGSSLPVSLFSGAEDLIKQADEQMARIIWEQEAGKMRVFADSDLFKKRQGGTTLEQRLLKMFVQFSGEPNEKDKIKTHAPTLRTQQQIEALNEILRRIESATNIGKGTISDLQDVRQTATQFAGGKKAFYSKVDTYESELMEKYKHCAYVFAYMASAYIGVAFNDEISITFNDMSRKDPAQMKQIAMQEVSAGLLNKYEYRQMFYGEEEETAKANVPIIETGGFVI